MRSDLRDLILLLIGSVVVIVGVLSLPPGYFASEIVGAVLVSMVIVCTAIAAKQMTRVFFQGGLGADTKWAAVVNWLVPFLVAVALVVLLVLHFGRSSLR
jgi:hypothetical protein